MGDYTSRVGLDTTNYQASIKQLLGIVKAFNKEAERTDRIQRMLSTQTERTSTEFVTYRQKIEELTVKTRLLGEAKKKAAALVAAGKSSAQGETEALKAQRAEITKLIAARVRLQRQIRTPIGQMATYREKGQIKKSDVAGVKPLTANMRDLGTATSKVHTRLASAHKALEKFHKTYEHWGEMQGLEGLNTLTGKLTKLGLPAGMTEKIRNQAEKIRAEYIEVFKDPAFQNAMRVDKVLGNAEGVAREYEDAFAKINRSMRPYINSSEKAKRLQREILDLTSREAALRTKIATTKSKQALPGQNEKKLKETGDLLGQKILAYDELTQAKAQEHAQKLMRSDKRLKAPVGLKGAQAVQGVAIRRNIEDELAKIEGVKPTEVLRQIFTGTPQERANMQERFGALYSNIRRLEQMQDAVHGRKLQQQKQERVAAQEAAAAHRQDLAQRMAAHRVEPLRREDLKKRVPFTQEIGAEDEIARHRLVNKIKRELAALDVSEQKRALASLKSSNAQEVADAREKYAALYQAQKEYSSFREDLEQRDNRAKKASEDEVALRQRQWNNAARKEAEEAAKINNKRKVDARKAKLLKEEATEQLIPKSASWATKVAVVKEVDAVAEAYARSGRPLRAYASNLAKIRNGDAAVIKSLPKVAQALRRVEVAANETDRSVKHVGLTMETIARLTFARLLTHAFYGMTTRFWEASRAALDLGTQIARIETLSKRMPIATDAWRRGIRDLSNEYNFVQEDVGKAIYETLSNQIGEGQGALEINKIVAPFAKLTGATLADSVDLISAALNAFNLEGADSERIAAQLFRTIDLGRVTATDMANTFGRVASFTSLAKVEMSDMLGMISELTISGLRFNRASTFIINVMNKMAKPTPAFKQFLKEQGAATGEEAIALWGLPGVLKKIFATTQGSLDEMGKMVQDIRAMIGMGGLTKDLEGLQATIDEIENVDLEEYRRDTEHVMQSNSQVVERELNKIRNAFVEVMNVVIDTTAEINRFSESVVAGSIADVTRVGGYGLLAGTMYGAPALGAHKIFGSKKDIIRQYAETRDAGPFPGVIGKRTLRQQFAAKVYFEGAVARSTKAAMEAGTKAAVPGIGALLGIMVPRLLGITGLAYGAYKLTEMATPAISKLLADQRYHTQELLKEAGEGFDEIRDRAFELTKELREAQKAQVGALTRQFQEMRTLQEEALSNYEKNYAKGISFEEKRLQTDITVLGAVEKFLMGRFKSDQDFRVSQLHPIDRMPARGNILMAQRQTISEVARTNPAYAAELMQEWFTEAQSLRKEIQKFAGDRYGNPQLAGHFMRVTDNMVNGMVETTLRQLGVEKTGSLIGDMLAIRRVSEGKNEELTELQTFHQDMNKRLDEGLTSWEGVEGYVATLNRTQQKIFEFYYQHGPLGSLLGQVVGQKGQIKGGETLGAAVRTRKKTASLLALTDTELLAAYDPKNQKGIGQRLIQQLHVALEAAEPRFLIPGGGMAAVPLETPLREKLTATLDDLRIWREQMQAAGGKATPETRQQMAKVGRDLEEVAERTLALIKKQTPERIGPDWESWRLYNHREYQRSLEDLLAASKNKTLRFGAYTSDNPEMQALMGQFGTEYTPEMLARRTEAVQERASQQEEQQRLLGLGQGRTPEQEQRLFDLNEILKDSLPVKQVWIDAERVAFTSSQIDQMLNPNTPAVGKALGGRIGGPRGTDTVPAWLTPGEFVVNARSARQHAPLLNAINSQYLAGGGSVEDKEKERRLRNFRERIQLRQAERNSTVEQRAENLRRAASFAPLSPALSPPRGDLRGRPGITRDAYGRLHHADGAFLPSRQNVVRARGSKITRDAYGRLHYADGSPAYPQQRSQHPRQLNIVRDAYGRLRRVPIRSYDPNAARGRISSGDGRSFDYLPPDARGHFGENWTRSGGIKEILRQRGFQAALKEKRDQELLERAAASKAWREGGRAAADAAYLAKLRAKDQEASPEELTPLKKRGWLGRSPFGIFMDSGGSVPRAFNVRPNGGYYSQGGQVTNSTVVNAKINLTSTGSNARDAREVVRGINREAHRGGLTVRTNS